MFVVKFNYIHIGGILMKRKLSLFVAFLLIISAFLCGCSKPANDYIVNNDGVINVGLLLPLSGDNSHIGNQILDGINFATNLAPGVNLDERYEINLVIRDINMGIDDAKKEFVENKVAAVICASGSKEKTDALISAFKNESTALLFTDLFSDKITEASNAVSISIPYSYQTSVAASYFSECGYKTGAVIIPDDDYSKKAADLFKGTFIANGGSSVSVYTYDEYEGTFNANTIAGSELEFAFVIGPENETTKIFCQLKDAGSDIPVMISEVYNKTDFEADKYNNMMFISKFEKDDENYIGTDFIKTYSNMMTVNSSDITSAIAYGYDAYMMVYGALMSQNSSAVSASKENSDSQPEIKSSAIISTLKGTAHLGVTDSITIHSDGLAGTNFLYLDSILNSNSVMLNRYNYVNDDN